MAKIIGIGGASRSGKSSLAKKLKDHFASKRVWILDQDDFVKPDDQLPKIQDRIDWEHPESIDLPSLLSEIAIASKNNDIVIIEGLLAFYFDELNARYDYSIFVQISKETFIFRRQQETRWGTEPKWYVEHVWISHLIFGQFAEADLTISGENELPDSSFRELLNHIDL
jgi:nicotinamide/nicotinate riboside kinase